MSKRVLVVDDSSLMRSNLIDIFTKNGYEIVGEAADGLEAIEKFKEHKPDLVTMDIVMPEMNGIESVKKIVEVEPGAVIIMCSAMGQQALVIEAIQAGARDFVIKPFQAARLIQAVERAFAG